MAKAQLMLLGTFHFVDGGLDLAKSAQDIDILSPKGQAEVELILDRLEQFKPSTIAIEAHTSRQTDIDQEYQAFCAGAFELSGNEIHQLGFKLARRLHHARVQCIDVQGRYYSPPVDLEAPNAGEAMQDFDPFRDLRAYAAAHGQQGLVDEWLLAVQAAGGRIHSDKLTRPLRDMLYDLNTEASILDTHSYYLTGPFRVGSGRAYPGVDFVTAWYSRNLRIFANLQRITQSADDRILLIIGAGHVPILRHCAIASSDYQLVEACDYLR
jgi:Family of unknown function (DUF5694)